MVQELVRESFSAGGTRPDAAEVERYYEAHRAEFERPERVRTAHLLVRKHAGEGGRAAARAAAERLAARLAEERRTNPIAFASLAREASQDEASRAAGGDMGYLTRAELAVALGTHAAEAAFALARVGDVAGPLESEAGFHLLELTGREPGTSRALPEVRSQLEARMTRERTTRDFDALVARLREAARVEVLDEELARLGTSSTPTAR